MSTAFDSKNLPLLRTMGSVAAGTALYAAGSWLVHDRYYQLILTIVPIWAAVGVAFNLFSGYSGLLSFGHAAFFGIGAYTVALLFVIAGVSPWIGIVVAGAVGGLAGLVIGYPTFRLRGHYFALAMLAYPLVLLYLLQWLGFQEVSFPMVRESAGLYMQFADQRIYILIASVLLAGSLAINLAIAPPPFGFLLLGATPNAPR